MVRCDQCGYGLAPGDHTCRRCGELHPQDRLEMSAIPAPLHSTPSRRRVADSSTSQPGEVEAQQIRVQPTTVEAAPTDALEQLTSAPKPPRRTVLRVSPFVFFLAPMLSFYLSAVLASYTLHLGSGGGTCPESLRSFLWGAILAGYVFVLGFSAMLVGPRWASLQGKWLAIVVYVVLLGILTGKGARQLLSDDNTNECISSAWYRTCWVITGFYCIFWLCLAVLVLYEVFHSCLFPSHDRVVILGVGAGLNKLKVPKHAKSVMEIFKHKFPMPDVLKRAAKPHPGGARPGADGNIDARREAELELALMDDPTGNAPLMSPSQTDVRKNNFFGDSATEKRRGSQKDSALADDQTIIPSRPTSIVRVRSTNSVAPSPAESEDEAEEKRPSITTTGGLGGGKSFTVHPQRSDLAGEEEKENSSRGSGGEEDDPFQAKIAANKRAQEQRRRELAEITRATEAMAAQREQQQPAPPAFDPANLPPLSTANSGAPAGILRGPSTATNDRFKMVEFHHGSRLEEVKRIETEESRGESSAGEDGPWGSPGQSPSTMQNPQQQQQQFDQNRPPSQAPPKFLPPLEEYRGGPPVAQSPYSYAPLPPPSSMQQQPQQQQQPSLYPAGAQTPQNPAYGYTHIPAGSPYANAAGPGPQFASNYNAIPAGSPSAMASPLPSSSAMLPIGPVYPERGPPPPPGGQPPVMVRLDPNDPNRFSKLMQQRNAEQPQRGWPPPPPRQQGQPQQPPTNPARYNTIDDDLSF